MNFLSKKDRGVLKGRTVMLRATGNRFMRPSAPFSRRVCFKVNVDCGQSVTITEVFFFFVMPQHVHTNFHGPPLLAVVEV